MTGVQGLTWTRSCRFKGHTRLTRLEKILADDCLNLPAGPDFTKVKLVEGVHKSQGQAPPYIASEEDMHVFMLGDTAIAMYVKEYAVEQAPAKLTDTT